LKAEVKTAKASLASKEAEKINAVSDLEDKIEDLEEENSEVKKKSAGQETEIASLEKQVIELKKYEAEKRAESEYFQYVPGPYELVSLGSNDKNLVKFEKVVKDKAFAKVIEKIDFEVHDVCKLVFDYVKPSSNYSCIIGNRKKFDFSVEVRNLNVLLFNYGNAYFIIFEGVT